MFHPIPMAKNRKLQETSDVASNQGIFILQNVFSPQNCRAKVFALEMEIFLPWVFPHPRPFGQSKEPTCICKDLLIFLLFSVAKERNLHLRKRKAILTDSTIH
jgi:hypothetical protein